MTVMEHVVEGDGKLHEGPDHTEGLPIPLCLTENTYPGYSEFFLLIMLEVNPEG